MKFLTLIAAALMGASIAGVSLADARPVLIGLDAEFGHKTSSSAQAIERGIGLAIDEINGRGGVLGGRPLKLVSRDNRSVPARAKQNIRELAEMDDLVAIFTGKFSPVALEVLPLIHERRLCPSPLKLAHYLIETDGGFDGSETVFG
jgi:branched-chain amino acid transport system substrate-binding protein